MKIYNIEQYSDVGWGESLFIIGNGSSIQGIDLSVLPSDKTMTVNRSWKVVPARFHSIIMHSGYVRDVAEQVEQPEVLFIAGSPTELETKYRSKLKNEVCFVARKSPDWSSSTLTPQEFMDLGVGWVPTHTGLFSIQVAYYMGYKNIFLIGFDGYGCHFEEDYINPLDDHKRHKKELQFLKDAVDKLREDELDFQEDEAPYIYNVNPSNAYNVFDKISLVDAIDLANGDI